MTSAVSLDALALEFPPDCVEFVPGRTDIFVIGTYHLEEHGSENVNLENQERQGSLILCSIKADKMSVPKKVPAIGTLLLNKHQHQGIQHQHKWRRI